MSKVELEELVVKLAVENQNLITGLKASQKSTEDAMNKMSASLKEMVDKSEKQGGRFQKIMDTALGFVGGQAILGGINAAKDAIVGLFSSMAGDGLQGAMATEDAMNKLAISMALNGNYSRDAAKAMEDFAGKMQATTRYGDDAVISAAALIESIGRLKSDALPGATEAAINLSAALGIDLNTAAQMVGKAAAGETGTFKRYGIAIQEGATNAETFANTLDALGRFSGAAAGQVKTFSGSLELMKNNYGDVTKTAMQAVTQNQAVLNVMAFLNQALIDTAEYFKNNKQQIREWVANGLIKIIEAAQMVVTALDAIVRAGEALYRGLEMTFSGLGFVLTKPFAWALEQIAGAMEAFGLEVPASLQSWQDGFKAAADTFSESFIKGAEDAHEALNGDTMLGALAVKVGEMGLAAQAGFDQVKAGAESVVEPVNAATTAMATLNEEQRKLAEDGRALAEELLIKGTEDSEARNALLFQEIETKGQMLDAAYEQGKISEEQYLAALDALDAKYDDEERKRAEKKRKSEIEMDQQKLQAASQFFSGMSALARQGGAETFGIAKRLAQAQAITDGIAAVQKALSAPPGFPWNAAAVAGVAAQTAANVASINAQNFNTGGTVPGIGFQDTVPAMLTPGEEVVNKSTSSKLRDFLDNGSGESSGGSQRIDLVIAFKDDAFEIIETRLNERDRLGISVRSA